MENSTANTSRGSLRIAPSLLAANFARLGDEVAAVCEAGADWIHLDVMDGHFVPNLTFGPPVISAIRSVTSNIFDVHLMVDEPVALLPLYADAGADRITVHAEACDDLPGTIRRITELGCSPGVAIKPGTNEEVILPVLELVDLVLVMTVEPGWGGQKMIKSCVEKVGRLRERVTDVAVDIQVDGGIGVETAAEVYAAGANVLVAGSEVFGGSLGGYSSSISAIRSAALNGRNN